MRSRYRRSSSRGNETPIKGQKKVMTMIYVWDENKVCLAMGKEKSNSGS